MPDDFYIIYKSGESSITKNMVVILDTKDNIIGKDMFLGEYIFDDYYISAEDLQTIYDYVIKCEITKLDREEPYKYKNKFHEKGREPNYYYSITINIESTVYTINFDETIQFYSTGSFGAPKNMKNLDSFHKYLKEFIQETNEYKNFPEIPYENRPK